MTHLRSLENGTRPFKHATITAVAVPIMAFGSLAQSCSPKDHHFQGGCVSVFLEGAPFGGLKGKPKAKHHLVGSNKKTDPYI